MKRCHGSHDFIAGSMGPYEFSGLDFKQIQMSSDFKQIRVPPSD